MSKKAAAAEQKKAREQKKAQERAALTAKLEQLEPLLTE
jgi:hypothetical protein